MSAYLQNTISHKLIHFFCHSKNVNIEVDVKASFAKEISPGLFAIFARKVFINSILN